MEKKPMDEVRIKLFIEMIDKFNGNISAVARALLMHPRSVRYAIDRWPELKEHLAKYRPPPFKSEMERRFPDESD